MPTAVALTGAGPVVELLAADDAPLLARPFYAGGDPGPIAASLAHVPELLEAALPFLGASLGSASLDFRTREIVILRTSAQLSCRYCIASHTPVALDAGLSSEQVHALRGESEASTCFSDDDRTLIDWIDAVAGRGTIAPDVERAARGLFADHVLVELTLLITTTLLLNRYATSLRLPVGDETLQRLAREGMALL